MTVLATSSKVLVALSPGIGAAPGVYATVTLAAPSCGYLLAEIESLYPSASSVLRDVALIGSIIWVVWIVAFLRASKWRKAIGWTSISGRLAAVGSILGGVAIGIVVSLIAYAVVAGVEDMCAYVSFPIVLLGLLFLVVPALIAYLAIEVVVFVKRKARV